MPDLHAYKTYLETHPEEWQCLDALCRVTVSRFYRDRVVWDFLGEELLVDMWGVARRQGDGILRCWSAGCASGEEPYTLALVGKRRVASEAIPPRPRIVASESNSRLLARAHCGVFDASSLRDLPFDLRSEFSPMGGRYRIHPEYREAVEFVRQDVRQEMPAETFHLVLCRNLVFTYYDESLRGLLLYRLAERLVPGGALIIGIHEALPAGQDLVSPRNQRLGIYTRPIRS